MTAFDANGLPDVVLLQIFRVLKFSDLCKVGRVCRRWYTLSRSQALWTSVDASAPKISSTQMDKLASVLTGSVRWLHVSSFLHRGQFLSPKALCDLRSHCPGLSTLVVENARLTTLDDFSPITVADFPDTLETLSLRRSFFQADQFFSLLAVRNLSILDLSFCWCLSDKDIPFLTELPNLRELYLEYCEDIRDTGVALVVSRGHNLRTLALDGTRITNEAIRTVAENAHGLERLYIGSTAVTDVGVFHLCRSRCLSLRELCLFGTRVTAEATKALAERFPQLLWLNLEQTLIGVGDGIPCITKVALPDCHVLAPGLPFHLGTGCTHSVDRLRPRK
ncbi:unnamed protein product [Ixodes hexagonus]